MWDSSSVSRSEKALQGRNVDGNGRNKPHLLVVPMLIMPAQNEYRVAMGHNMVDHEHANQDHLQSESAPTFTKKKGIWSGLKHMFHQRQRTPSRNRNERRQFSTDLSSLSYSCLGQARQDEEEMYGINSQQRSRLSRNLSMSHESVFQMEPLPSQSSEERLITPRTSSSTALPMMMQTELQAVLRQRQSRSRNFSKQSNDFTDDEDLGLPKSLQNSPGDFSDDLVVSSVLRSSGPWGASRHHSSCSDNSLLSLDSYDNKVDNDTRESMYYRDKSPGDVRNRSVSPGDRLISKYSGDGNLSHQAARHKMAIRPKRNHAVRHHRRLQQLEEVHEIPNEIIHPSNGAKDLGENSSSATSAFDNKGGYSESTNQMHYKSEEENSDLKSEEMKTKSKSLDISFRAAAPSASTLKEMSKEGNKKTKSKTKLEQEGSFLSRLFGSKRHKMKTSVSKTDLEDNAFKAKSQGQRLQAPDPPITAHNMESNPYKQGYYHPQDIMSDANKLSPPKYKPSVKQKPPPPPPDSVPPSVRKSEEFSSGVNETADTQAGQRSVPKSQSFRQTDCLVITQDEPEYPSLPAQVSHADVILKKNKSMSSVLSAEASHQKFRSSIENWSFANEGLKKSIGSLADRPIMTSQSNESLKTITSLLEEPDLLEHTSVLDDRLSPLSNNRISENILLAYSEEKSCISNEINSALTNRRPVMEDGFFTDQVHKNVITNVKIDDYKPPNDTDKYTFESMTESFGVTENICNIKDSWRDTMDDFHTKLKSSALTSGNCEGDSCNMADQMRFYPCNGAHGEGLMLSDEENQNEENVCLSDENEVDDLNSVSDFVPKYQDEEVEKLIKLADNSANLKLEQAENFSPTNNDNNQASLEMVESDLDLSISSLEVFHTPKSLDLSQMSFHTAQDKSVLAEEKTYKESLNPEKEIISEESQETLCPQLETPVDLLQTLVKNSDDLEIKSEPVNQTPALTKPPKPQRLQMDTLTSETMQHDELNVSKKAQHTQENNLEPHSSQPNVTTDTVYKPILVEIQNNTLIDKEPAIKQETGELKTEENLTNYQSPRKSIDNSTQKILIETKKPEISPKPVPAPRHFFLKKTSTVNQNDDPNRSPKLEEGETTELINVFARRSKSTTVLGLDQVEKMSDAENENDPQMENGDKVINVKERAKSFSGIQSYQFGPKPFRPSSIAAEIRMTKPMNIPPKPKLAQKPVPAPRQFRSISHTDVVSTKENYQKKVTKSASNLQEAEQKVSEKETKSKTNLENATAGTDIIRTEEVTDVSANLTRTDDVFAPKQTIKEEKSVSQKLTKKEEKIVTQKQNTDEEKIVIPKQMSNEEKIDTSKLIMKVEKLATSKEIMKEEDLSNHVDTTNLEEIQVKKIVNNFQKSKSPEKPIRKFPPVRDVLSDDILGSLPLAELSAKDDSSRNVMSIVTKLNAMST